MAKRFTPGAPVEVSLEDGSLIAGIAEGPEHYGKVRVRLAGADDAEPYAVAQVNLIGAEASQAPATNMGEVLAKVAPGPVVTGPASKESEVARIAAQFAEAVASDSLADGDPDESSLAEMRSAEQAAERAKHVLLAREHELREADMAARAEARKAGRPLPPVRSVLRSSGVDASFPLDKDGKRAGTTGMVTRWVRTTDAAERPNAARAKQFHNWGYKPVLSRVDNEPITQWSHMLMEAPPLADAERRAYHEKDLVALDRDKRNQWLAETDAANRQMGREVFQPFEVEREGASTSRTRVFNPPSELPG